ncbi:uncharacterized protein LOC120944796 [Rana temporaria]|uniref:uncharacterized protein LOC120944796 n=1 Tax=Rana temporaria TaxID=8407 RepID=UPI001AACA769|nr:uncharacterized protein LOC120944796 [Rana temporaria]
MPLLSPAQLPWRGGGVGFTIYSLPRHIPSVLCLSSSPLVHLLDFLRPPLSSSACTMVSNEGCSEGTPGPNYDARSTVCLLDADATDDLHNAPLDADRLLALQGSELNCVVENIPEKEIHTNVQNDPGHRCSGRQCSGHQCISPQLPYRIFALGLICLLMAVGLPPLMYMLYQDVHYKNLLQTLIERLDAQSQILTQMAANRNIAGYNPGGP